MLTFHRRPLAVVVDRNFSSRAMRFHTLGRILVAVAGAEVVSDIAMAVEAVSARHPDYLAADCRNWVTAVGSLY